MCSFADVVAEPWGSLPSILIASDENVVTNCITPRPMQGVRMHDQENTMGSSSTHLFLYIVYRLWVAYCLAKQMRIHGNQRD